MYPSTCGWVYIFQREREREREREFPQHVAVYGFSLYISERCPFCLVSYVKKVSIYLWLGIYIFQREREREREREICICMTLVTQITRQGGNISNFIDTKSLI